MVILLANNKRKSVNTTLDSDLYKAMRILALQLDLNANDLIEEGMRMVIQKYNYNYEIKDE